MSHFLLTIFLLVHVVYWKSMISRFRHTSYRFHSVIYDGVGSTHTHYQGLSVLDGKGAQKDGHKRVEKSHAELFFAHLKFLFSGI